MVTAEALLDTQASDLSVAFGGLAEAFVVKSVKEFEALWYSRLDDTRVGKRDGNDGDPGRSTRRVAEGTVTVLLEDVVVDVATGLDEVLRVVVPCANRGILFDMVPFDLADFTGLPAAVFFFAAVVDLVTRTGP